MLAFSVQLSNPASKSINLYFLRHRERQPESLSFFSSEIRMRGNYAKNKLPIDVACRSCIDRCCCCHSSPCPAAPGAEDYRRTASRGHRRFMGNDCLDALIAAPIPGSALFLGKAFANFILVMAVELIALPLFGVFYNVRWTSQFWQLMLVIVLGTWAMTVTGTIFSALTVNIRLREVMLPILNFPILIPALLGAMQLTSSLVAGKPITADNDSWLKMLIGFDIMYTAVSLVLVETVLVS